MIDSVLLKVSGYRFSQDIPVRREDIEVLLPEAIAYAINVWNAQNTRQKYEDIQVFGAQDSTFDFFTTVEVTPQYSQERQMYYVELPSRVQAIRGRSSIKDLFPQAGLAGYVKVSGRTDIIGIEGTATYYWHETVGNKSRLYIWNMGLPVCVHYVQYLANVTDIDENDDIPLPAGLGFQVVELVSNFILNSKPPDRITDDKPNS